LALQFVCLRVKVPTHLQWSEDGELHPEELAQLQTLLAAGSSGCDLAFRALEQDLKPSDWKPVDSAQLHSVR
jgi:hypothetical protein